MEGVAERLKAWNSPTYARTPLAPGPLSPQSSGSVPRPPTPPLSRSRSGVCLRRSSDGSAKSPSWFRPILTLQCGRGDRGGGRGPGGGLEASVPPPPSRSGPEALPRPLPRAHRGSYRNSAGLAVSRRPLRGPPGNRDEREGPGGPGRGGKGEIRETSLSGRPRQPGFGQGGRSL